MPLKAGGGDRLRLRARPSIQRTNQIRRIFVGADLAPGLVASDAWTKIDQLPSVKNLPAGRPAPAAWRPEMAGGADPLLRRSRCCPASCWCSPSWSCSTAGSWRRSSTWARCCWRRWARSIALHLTSKPVSLPVLIGILMLFGIVAKNSILLVDFAIEMINHGMERHQAIYRGRPQARPADRDDHRRHGRGHAADRAQP